MKILIPVVFLFIFGKLNAQYCTVSSNNGNRLYIDDFQLVGSINNTTNGFNNNTYQDFSSLSGDVVRGVSYTFQFTLGGETTRIDNAWYAIWIDFDDGILQSNDAIYVSAGVDGQNFSFNYTIPTSAPIGSHRLRVKTRGYGMSDDPCVSQSRTETEDYTINVVNPLNPLALDDIFYAVNNSTYASNSFDVSTNDFIGTSDGTDGEDYSIVTDPLTTTQGGTVTEASDGVFEYEPATGFIGIDDFVYTYCDAGGDCDTATVSIVVDYGACTPVSNSAGTHYITRFQLNGESTNIDNSSGDDGGYRSYINLAPADVYAGSTYTMDLDTEGDRSGWAAYIDYNQNGDFGDPGEQIYFTAANEEPTPYVPRNFTIPSGLSLGKRVLRVGSRRYFYSNDPCGTSSNPEEFEDYLIEVVVDPSSPRDISVSGGNSTINNNDVTTSIANKTDFGPTDSSSGSKIFTYTILNSGGGALTLGAGPIVFQPGSDVEFSIVSQPAAGTVIASAASVTFQISFTPRNVGIFDATVLIDSDDPDENPFTFAIQGEGAKIYPDTDNDGVSDNIDIDDDNDGIRDSDEQNICLLNPLSSSADVIFLNETFGAGTTRARINDGTIGVTTTYCFEDGTTARGPDECDNDINLGDGKYTVHYSVSNNDGTTTTGSSGPDVSSWAETVWYYGQDHTPGDSNGRMALFNASVEPGIFYETEIVGTVAGAPIDYSFWALNLDRADTAFIASELPRQLPNVTVNFYSLDKSVLYNSIDFGDIVRCNSDPSGMCALSEWINKSTSLTLPASNFIIQLVNNAPGGFGNDLALDDIKISQKLCDLDGDGVADVIDLDNDNDGIPNIYEIGKPAALASIDANADATSFGDGNWVDSNNNGMHDAYESFTPRDTDMDGVPDYLDLDSDNDGIFDVLEYDGFGDLDVNGDGSGEGSDAESIFSIDKLDGDGLLGLIDSNDNDADDLDHGTTGFVPPVDTDMDGMPDYLDIDSNDPLNDLSNGSDIDNSYYAHLDLDGDGRVDFTADVDGDGVNDGDADFDTGLYGAPIDLDTDLFVDFDGRNDYVLNATEVLAGLSDFTISAWVLLDSGSSNTASVFSERGMSMIVDPSGMIRVNVVNNAGTNYNLISFNSIGTDRWFNLSVRYDGPNGLCTLYINGVEEVSSVIANAPVATIAGNRFTLGKGYQETATDFFNGGIDEVRIFSKSIEKQALEQMMYQEIQFSGGTLMGKTIVRPFSNVDWSDLILHYDFKKVTGDQLFDVSSSANTATMFNIKSIIPQSAPLPYETSQDGLMSDPNTYLQPVVWSPSDLAAYPYSIIHVKHQNTLPISAQSSGIIVDTGATLTILDGNEGNNKWYLKLDGTIDLLGDAQLVQTEGSELDVTSAGKILRRQEGKSDVFSYNYWSSPVGIETTASNNNDFNLGMMQDADGSGYLQFTGTGVRTPPVTSPATISGRWLHTFMNGVSYNDWNRINSSDPIAPGHGWTQKGAGAAGEQEILFEGKPNNGVINIAAVDTDGDPTVDLTSSLLGNPYPSALDARLFIQDNLSVIDGAVYLWDQFRGTDHLLANYEGGYATVTRLATTRASQIAGSGALGGPTTGTVVPTFFLPVSQGFFVTVRNSGTLTFNNGQRVFKREAAGESIFVSAPGAVQPIADRSDYQDPNVDLIRLELSADNGASKEIVLGFADFLTDGIDLGYDGPMFDSAKETDLYTSHLGRNYVIRALGEIESSKIIPLTLHGKSVVNYKIGAKEIANIPASQELYLRDKELNVYHDLRSGDYFFNVATNGKNSSRFEIVFKQATLGLDEETLDQIDIYYLNTTGNLYVDHLTEPLQTLSLYDLSGKMLFRFRESELTNIQNGISIPGISSGIYLVEIESQGTKKSVKIAVQ